MIIIYSCGQSFGPEDEPSSYKYFPLNVGNEWHYGSVEADSVVISVSQLTMIFGKTYFKLSPNPSKNILRVENGAVYKNILGRDYLHLDFNRDIGDLWKQVYNNHTCYISSKSDTVITRTDTLYNCINIVSLSELDSSVSIYAQNIGLIYSRTYGKRSAIIGGGIGLEWAIIADSTINFK